MKNTVNKFVYLRSLHGYEMKALPISTQTFSKLRELDMLYVDKTPLIHQLLSAKARQYFLARPRRFGKSMTISTIKSIYEGEKQYFKDLWIEDKWDWSITHPVIHLQFASMAYDGIGLKTALIDACQTHAKQWNLNLEAQDFVLIFKELIQKTAQRYGRVVILIDEYDKPIIDYLEKEKRFIAEENRSILRQFYSIIKDADPYIEFFFMTGVSKFSQTGIFSHLNHLNDITLDEKYVDLVGYTPTEFKDYFADWLVHCWQKFPDLTWDAFMDQIRSWYNGFSWDGENTVYNPYSILNLLDKRSFEDYWFKTGTPTFLLKLMREQEEFLFNDLQLSGRLLASYDLENLDLRTILFQTGYLTIKHIDHQNGIYTLDYPNREVEQSMSDYILAELLHTSYTSSGIPVFNIKKAFLKNDLPKVIQIINAILKDVPSHLIESKRERFYHALVHLHFRYLGLLMDSEVHTSDGRMDAVVKTPTHVYIIEFKLDEKAAVALQQIRDKGYADKFGLENRDVVLVGVGFDSEKKCVGDWGVEKWGLLF